MKELTQLNLVDSEQDNDDFSIKTRDIAKSSPVYIRILKDKVGSIECAKLLGVHDTLISRILRTGSARKSFEDLAQHIVEKMQAERGYLFFMVKIDADRGIQFKKWLDENKITSKSMGV